MNLKSLNCPDLSKREIILLNQANILTAEQFVSHANLEVLSKQCAISFSVLKSIKKFIIGTYAPIRVSASEKLLRSKQTMHIIPTGCKQIDELISNGIYSNEIVEICGPTSSGKSELCSNVAIQMLKQYPGYNCIIIDTNRNFSAKRLHDLLNAKMNASNDIIKRFKSIQVIYCKNLFALINIITQLSRPCSLDSKTSNESTDLSANLLIIDSFSSLFNIFKHNDNYESTFYLNTIMNKLKFLKAKFNMSIILTTNNHKVYSSSNSFSLFNDESWKSLSNVIVRLSKFKKESDLIDPTLSSVNEAKIDYLFELLKLNRAYISNQTKNNCLFRITDQGLGKLFYLDYFNNHVSNLTNLFYYLKNRCI